MGTDFFPAIPARFIDGEKSIHAPNGQILATVNQFWQWAFSDLIGNTVRGAFAEYLVACAIGVENEPRVMWDSYDLQSPEGITIEVKSSGYIQTWGQRKLSNIVFGIRPTIAWNKASNSFDDESKRQADIYVFCVHKHKDQTTIDTTDLNQWDFYLLPTRVLNEKAARQKSITLSALIKLGATPCAFSELHSKIIELCR